MIRITITPAAYEAIAGTLPWGTVGVEPQRAENGDYFHLRDAGRREQAQGAARSR
jgi:hypothetical protein